MKKRVKKHLLATAALVLSIFTFTSFGLPYLAHVNIENILADYGLTDITVTRLNFKSGEIMFSDIRLDKDGFSTIETIRASTYWPALLTPASLFSQIIIDNLILTGEVKPAGKVDIAGWRPSAAISLADVDRVVLNSGQINLITSEGGIRLETKGHIVPSNGGNRQIQAVIWARQHQLILDSRWDMSVNAAGSWEVAANIDEARLNFNAINLSRAQGWFNLSYDGHTKGYNSAGQLTAGQIKLGKDTVLTNASVTLDGPLDNYKAIVNGQAATYEDVYFSADLSFRYGKLIHSHVVISATDNKSLFSFLESFKSDLQNVSSYGDGLTSLLITQGNISRIKKTLSKTKYDQLDLVIQGSAYDLTGKVVAKQYKEGSIRTSVISMNPGE